MSLKAKERKGKEEREGGRKKGRRKGGGYLNCIFENEGEEGEGGAGRRKEGEGGAGRRKEEGKEERRRVFELDL